MRSFFVQRLLLLSAIAGCLLAATTPVTFAQQLTPAMKAEFGAATWIPDDAGFYAASYRNGERWTAFTKTKAYNELLTMPGVQMGLGWIKQQPQLAQLTAMRAQIPLLDLAINVLQDSYAQEMFFYVDEHGPAFTNQLGGLYNTFFFSSVLQGINQSTGALPDYTEEKNLARLVRSALDAQKELRLPGMVMGARLSDPQAGKNLIAGLAPLLQQVVPLPMVQEKINGGEYLTLPINAAMFLNPQTTAAMQTSLRRLGLEEEAVQQFVQFVASQSVAISLGMRGDFLILSIGADSTHLNDFEAGSLLVESEALTPLRQHFKSRLISLAYLHEDFTSARKLDVPDLVGELQDLLWQAKDKLPPGLAERVAKDAVKLLTQLNEALPEAAPVVSGSFWNRGVESFSFSALFPGQLDSSKPLSILPHAGKSPLLVSASHATPSQPHYDHLIGWLKTFYGYFEDYAVPQFSEEELAKFKEFEAIALPAFKEFHVTTRDYLLPSLEGGQSLFALDTEGAVTRNPESKELFSKPIRFPRPAMVVELKDSQKFISAWGRYRKTFNKLMGQVSEKNPDVSPFELPAPESRALASGTLYTYAIPAELELPSYLNNDFEPHALVTKKYFVFSLSPSHSEQLLATNSWPKSSLVDFEQPTGRVFWFDFIGLKELVCDDVDVALELLQQQEELDATMGVLMKIHVDKLRKALGAIRSYRSRTYEENGLQVTHSWWHLQDIE